ncbi:MAG: TonB-dependent receptor, partial [Bacteroidota bacterium]
VQSNANTTFFNQRSRLRFNWIIGKGIIFRTTLTHQFYDGLSANLDNSYYLWNASIGKKLFKNQLGEINISAFDLLKQNQSISRTVTEVYIEDLQTQALQQYFLLNFIYNFRNFGLSKRTSEEEERNRERGRRERWGRGG